MCPIQKKGFCSTVHQKEYKKYHDNNSTGAMANLSHSILLPSLLVESELVVEEEPAEPTNSEMTREDGTNRTPLFETANDDEDDADDGDLEQTDLNEMTGATGTAVDDEVTLEFYSRMGRPNNARQQCLRYHRWPSSISNHSDENEHDEEDCGGPLWIHSQNRPTETDISPCCHCGAPRNFEFQLMPQMLHYLLPKESSSSSPSSLLDAQRKQALLVASDIVENNAKEVSDEFKQIQQETLEKVRNELLNDTNDTSRGGTLNWGVVCIYTCTSSCSSESSNNSDKRSSLGAYQEEFAWRQEPLS
jgi:pre-rRNA-processing protein TSR4